MDRTRWRQIEDVFQRVVGASGPARNALLQQSCGDDESLRREVESLLEYDDESSRFIETPAFLARRTGTTIRHYHILEEIGGGGMGVVYRARDAKLDRVVAIKFLARSHAAASATLDAFRSEARAASSLNHPNACVIYDIDVEGDEHFIVMEFVEGRTLADLLASGPLDSSMTASIGSQIADALAAADRNGIVHRDIKPANIMVTAAGVVKVLDFGLAKLVNRQVSHATRDLAVPRPILGTLPYMSPEHLRGGDVDHRTDVFALGAVLYEMATGKRPFEGATTGDVVDGILNRQPVSPRDISRGVSDDLNDIILRCLAKEPAERYHTADAVGRELRRLLTPSTTPSSNRTPSRWVVAGLALAMTGAALATGFVIVRSSEAPAPVRWEQLTDFPDSATSPALSADGRLLAFIRGASTFVGPGDVYVMALPDGEPVQLTDDDREKQDPLFTPDGSRVVYTTGPLPYDAWSVPVAGGRANLLMPNASMLTWTSEGHVMFGAVRGAPHMAIVAGTERRTELRDVYVPSRTSEMAHRAYLSPNKKWVIVAEMDTTGQGWLPCRLVPFDGSSSGTQVGPATAGCTSAAWSPDGQWMYMSSAARGGYHIWRQRFPRGEAEQVTFGPTQEEGVAMAPDGRSLITSVGVTKTTLSIRDRDGERRIDSEATVTFPRFSADGRRLFYLALNELRDLDRQSGELWVIDLHSNKRERVMPGFRVITYAISPDGLSVAATVNDGGRGSELWMAAVDRQTPPRRLEWPTPVAAALFNPAGGLFLLVNEANGDFVYHTDLSGEGGRKISSHAAVALLTASPSGKWLLVRAQLPREAAGMPGVVALPVNGGEPVSVFRIMWPMASWTADGKHMNVRLGGENGRSLAVASVPLSGVGELPPLPPGGLRSAEEAVQLPGATVMALDTPRDREVAAVATSADFSKAAIVRTAVHRNLYRVPLP